jgi:hypothetical protein
MDFISVKDFNKIQHYTKRNPPWIKLHKILWRELGFFRLEDSAKAHLIGLQIIAADCENKIPFDKEWIARQINATEPIDFDALFNSGYVMPWNPDASVVLDEERGVAENQDVPDASKALASCMQDAPLRQSRSRGDSEETREETEPRNISKPVSLKPFDPQLYVGGEIPSCRCCRGTGQIGKYRCACREGDKFYDRELYPAAMQ